MGTGSVVQYNPEKGCAPVILKTPEQFLLKDIMVALKQARTELRGIKEILRAFAKEQGVEVKDGSSDGS